MFENHSISPILREKLKTFIFEFTAKNDSSFTLVKTDFIVFARNEEKIVKRRHFWVIFNHCGLSLVNIKQTSSSYWSAIQNGSACNLIRNETSVHRVRLYLLYLTDYSLVLRALLLPWFVVRLQHPPTFCDICVFRGK